MQVFQSVAQRVRGSKKLLLVLVALSMLFVGAQAAMAQRRPIHHEFGCTDWNADQGCMQYSSCVVWDNGSWDCNYYKRGVDF
jgi:hypothetical protein